MNSSHEITSAKPAKAAREADRIVVGRATLEAKAAIANTAKPIVTGKGIYRLVSDTRVVVVVTVVVLSAMQFCPEASATKGEVQAVTQMLFY